MEEFNPVAIYNKKILLLLIPIIGATISLLYFFNAHNVQEYTAVIILLQSILITSGIWLGCNTIVVFLWKKFPWEFYPVKHLLIEIVLILLYTNVFAYTTYSILVSIGFINHKSEVVDLYTDVFVTNLITFFITSIHEAIFFYRQWKFNFSKSLQLEKEQLQAKFESLKNQIQPHFLFNSLNALSSLVYDNVVARNYIQNLSEFLRYILVNREHELVTFEHELDFTKKYIEIQQARYGTNIHIEFRINSEVLSFVLPPLVLQTLVENCIKHNIISTEKPLYIQIESIQNILSVRNNLQKRVQANSTGQGLQNIIQRYAFVSQHKVCITESITDFIVEVPLISPQK